jgi:hypothetical protein
MVSAPLALPLAAGQKMVMTDALQILIFKHLVAVSSKSWGLTKRVQGL